MAMFSDKEALEMKKSGIKYNFEKYKKIYKQGTQVRVSNEEEDIFPLMYGRDKMKMINLQRKIRGRTFSIVRDFGFLIKIKVTPDILEGQFSNNDDSLFIKREAILPTENTEYYSTYQEYYYSEWKIGDI